MLKILFLGALIFIASSSPVLAQNRKNLDLKTKTSTSSGLERAREVSGKTLLPEVRQKNIRALFTRMLSKFEAAITRLETLIVKIEERIALLKSTNPDLNTTQPETDLASAKDLIASAKTNLDNAKVQLENLVLSDTPGEEFKELRDLLKSVKTDLQQTHRLLIKIVNSLKRMENTK